jgi:hypothetical protein
VTSLADVIAAKRNNMKLYPIIFEAAKTVEEAIDSEMALFVENEPDFTHCILFKEEIIHDLIDAFLEDKRVAASKSVRMTVKAAKIDWLIKHIGREAIVGNVGAMVSSDNLYKVYGSSAVDKFGPLSYEILMAAIFPAYLRSDGNLTDDSRKVWNKMYQRQDVGRHWVGNFSNGNDELITSFAAAELTSEVAKDFSSDLGGGRWDSVELTEEIFNKELVEKLPPEDLAKLGPFYAYRLQPNKTTTVDYVGLMRRGNDLVEELAGTFKLTIPETEEVMTEASREHFDMLYKK